MTPTLAAPFGNDPGDAMDPVWSGLPSSGTYEEPLWVITPVDVSSLATPSAPSHEYLGGLPVVGTPNSVLL